MATFTNKNMTSRPRILVVGSLTPPDADDWLREKLNELSDSVFDALNRAGADYGFVEASDAKDQVGELLAQYDGLLVLGGGDADPACYGQAPLVDTMYGINQHADRFELGLIRESAEQDLPVLGICRGMQLINIAFGGTLNQEIGAGYHNGKADNSLMVDHPVNLHEHSKLRAIYGKKSINIRSAHHQSVSEVGQGLVVAANADDGIIEAIEAAGNSWVVGVQWHPEDLLASQDDFDLLLNSFLQRYLEKANSRQVPADACA